MISGFMEDLSEEFSPSDASGDVLIRGRHVRADLHPSEMLNGNGPDQAPGDVITRARHVRSDLHQNDPPHGTAPSPVQGDAVHRGRHVRADFHLIHHDPGDVVTRGRHVRASSNRTVTEDLTRPDSDLDLAPSSVSLLPTILVDVPPPPLHPAIVTEATDFLRFSRTRRLTRHQTVLSVLLVLAIVAGAGLWWTKVRGHNSPPPAHVAVTTTAGRTVVTLSKGSDDLPQLRQSLARAGHGALITSVPGGAVELNGDVVVGRGATLTITQTALLLRSTALTRVQLSTQGGRIDLVDDTVTSWTTQGAVDTATTTGRAEIVAAGSGAELNITNSRVVGLGSNVSSPGVSWRNGAGGTVRNSQFSQNWTAVYADRSGPLTISGSSFTSSRDDGVLLVDPGAGSTISSSSFAHNAQSGLEVDGAIGTLKLAGLSGDHNRLAGLLTRVTAGTLAMSNGLFYSNGQFGISANGGRLSLTGTKAWANNTGVSIDGGIDTLSGTDLSGNRQDGMYVTGAGAVVRATTDRFDHNSRSGVWVAGGRVTLTGGLLDENLTGIRIQGPSHYFRASGNTIRDNLKDGLALDVSPGIEIRGNVIEDNGDSAISTNKASGVKRFFKENTIAHNQTTTRIRAS
jgi:hypothetical protein